MRIRWAAVAALVTFLPLKAWALPDFAFDITEIGVGETVPIQISVLSNDDLFAWRAVWTVDPTKIEVINIVGGIPTTITSSDANGFSFDGFHLTGTAPGVIATVTLKGLVFGGEALFGSGAIAEVVGGQTDFGEGQGPMATVVPEPGTFVLLGFALSGLAGLRRFVALRTRLAVQRRRPFAGEVASLLSRLSRRYTGRVAVQYLPGAPAAAGDAVPRH